VIARSMIFAESGSKSYPMLRHFVVSAFVIKLVADQGVSTLFHHGACSLDGHRQTDAFKKPQLALPVNPRPAGHWINGSAVRYGRFFNKEIQQNHPSIED
jgi:hypothetical protein